MVIIDMHPLSKAIPPFAGSFCARAKEMILNGDVETGKTVLRDYINTELTVTSSGLTLLRSKRMVVFCAVWALPAMVRSLSITAPICVREVASSRRLLGFRCILSGR
jgi:hypothetical protein